MPVPARWRLDERPSQINVARPAAYERESCQMRRPWVSKTARSTGDASGRSSVKLTPAQDGFGYAWDSASTGTAGTSSSSPAVDFLPARIWRFDVADPCIALAATKRTWKLPVLLPGAHANVPPVFVASGVNVAPLLAGIFT